MTDVFLIIVFFILLLPGLAGIFLPFPGLLYMFIISLIYGFVDGFQHLGYWEIGILGGITLLSILLDYLSGILGAKYSGASTRSMIFGIIGTIIGIMVFPPFGGLVGVFLGILVSEIFFHKDRAKAIRAATGGFVGSIVGMLSTLVFAILFLFLFVIFTIK